jgi:hypothetical protein
MGGICLVVNGGQCIVVSSGHGWNLFFKLLMIDMGGP